MVTDVMEGENHYDFSYDRLIWAVEEGRKPYAKTLCSFVRSLEVMAIKCPENCTTPARLVGHYFETLIAQTKEQADSHHGLLSIKEEGLPKDRGIGLYKPSFFESIKRRTTTLLARDGTFTRLPYELSPKLQTGKNDPKTTEIADMFSAACEQATRRKDLEKVSVDNGPDWYIQPDTDPVVLLLGYYDDRLRRLLHALKRGQSIEHC